MSALSASWLIGCVTSLVIVELWGDNCSVVECPLLSIRRLGVQTMATEWIAV